MARTQNELISRVTDADEIIPGQVYETYSLHKEHPEGGKWGLAVTAEVTHRPERHETFFPTPSQREEMTTAPGRMGVRLDSVDPYNSMSNEAVKDYADAAKVRQPKLFGVFDQEKHSEIEGLFSTRSTAVRAPGLVGIMEHHAQTERGTTLLPSTDRSEHSERWVQKLQSGGVLGAGHERAHANDLTFWGDEPTYDISPSSSRNPEFQKIMASEVPPADIEAGRQLMRRKLKENRANQPVEYEPYNHPTLPGM